MLGRRLGRLGSAAFARSHSGCSDKQKEQANVSVVDVKKLFKTSPSSSPAFTKHHSLEPQDPSVPVSEAIRNRILKSGARFHGNDNICEFVREDEMPLLVDEVSRHMQGVLKFVRPSLGMKSLQFFPFSFPIYQERFTLPAAHLSSTRSTTTTQPILRAVSPKCSSWRRFPAATA